MYAFEVNLIFRICHIVMSSPLNVLVGRSALPSPRCAEGSLPLRLGPVVFYQAGRRTLLGSISGPNPTRLAPGSFAVAWGEPCDLPRQSLRAELADSQPKLRYFRQPHQARLSSHHRLPPPNSARHKVRSVPAPSPQPSLRSRHHQVRGHQPLQARLPPHHQHLRVTPRLSAYWYVRHCLSCL
jgi:hypothetical protein